MKNKQAPIGVAILAYEGFTDLVRCLRSIKFRSELPIKPIVFDNSEKTTQIRDYVQEAHPDAMYLNVGRNIGCSESRNIMLTSFLQEYPNAEYLCIMDQDVECKQGWLKAMMQTMQTHPDCGISARLSDLPEVEPSRVANLPRAQDVQARHRVAEPAGVD